MDRYGSICSDVKLSSRVPIEYFDVSLTALLSQDTIMMMIFI